SLVITRLPPTLTLFPYTTLFRSWLAEEIGLNMVFDNIVHTNTFHAHRLVKYASEHNKALPLIDLLFNSYFSWNENIGESHVLQRLAEQAGLLKGEVDTLLC